MMADELSVGAIVYSTNEEFDEPEYLLLHYASGHWDFPKGNREYGEDELQTAHREILEETGIEDMEFLKGFRSRIEYYYKGTHKLIHKEVVFYIAKTNTRKVVLSEEHIGYAWKKYGKALDSLTYQNAKNVLQEARTFLRKDSHLSDSL